MAIDKKRYPVNWNEISLAEREAAGWRCRWCKVPNAQVVKRAPGGFWFDEADQVWRDRRGAAVEGTPPGKVREVKIVLTVAHLGVPGPDGKAGDKHDKMDVRPENLAALCQWDHLTIDRKDHLAVQARNRAAKKRAAGQLELEAIT